MSFFYAESNNESTLDLFRKRGRYALNSRTPYRSVTDFFAEKYMYGRVNRIFTPIYVDSNRELIFKDITRKQSNNTNAMALDFVVDAFNDLAQNFEKAVQAGKISANDPFLSNLKVYKAYEDPVVRYNNYMNSYVANFKSICDGLNKKIENFDMMTDTLLKSMSKSKVTSPFSFSAYIKNRRTPITISGLAIEIANIDVTNDFYKAQLFLNSKNWEYFLNAAEVFGFMVDKNVPWRLVADIDSVQMQEYAKVYGHETTDDILNHYFSEPYFGSFLKLPAKMYNIYNTIKPATIRHEINVNGRILYRNKPPKNYRSLSYFKEDFNDDYFINLYCKMRFIEEESKYTESEQNLIIQDAQQIARAQNKTRAIRHFERAVNNTLDYSGNLQYYIDKERSAESKTETTQTISTTGY